MPLTFEKLFSIRGDCAPVDSRLKKQTKKKHNNKRWVWHFCPPHVQECYTNQNWLMFDLFSDTNGMGAQITLMSIIKDALKIVHPAF